MSLNAAGEFLWTPAARRSVNVLIALQAMHMCASQVVVLASEDLLVNLVQKSFRKRPVLLAAREEKRERLAAGDAELRERLPADKAEAVAALDAEFEEEVRIKANSRAAHIMSAIQVVIAVGDFIIGPVLGAAADAYGRKFLVLIAPAVQGLFRLAIALKPSVPLFVAFQMAQGITNIAYGRVLSLMIGDIVPRHTFEYQKVGGTASKVNTVLGLFFLLVGGRVSLKVGFLSSALLNLVGLLAILFMMKDTLRVADRVAFTLRNSHPFAFISFFNKSPMLRRIGLFSLFSEAPNFQGYEGLFFIHKFNWMKKERTTLQIIRRSVHYFNFNYYEWMARNLGLTGTLRWSLRFTALESFIPGLLPSSSSRLCMGGIVGASVPIMKWKALNAFKTRETMLAGAGQGELQAAEASLRVPLRIICIPLFNWIYAKGSERGMPGVAHILRGGWQLFSSEILMRILFPSGIGDVIWR
jgi:MFS family permease